MKIHPTAIIASGAEIDTDVVIGPYTVIEKDVKIGSGTEIGPNTFIEGVTSIGKNNQIGAFASIGTPPQDLRYNNEPTKLNIGDDNLIREYTSIHRGTVGGGGVTTIGNGNMSD